MSYRAVHQSEAYRTSFDFDVTVTKDSPAVYITDRTFCEGCSNGGLFSQFWCFSGERLFERQDLNGTHLKV